MNTVKTEIDIVKDVKEIGHRVRIAGHEGYCVPSPVPNYDWVYYENPGIQSEEKWCRSLIRKDLIERIQNV